MLSRLIVIFALLMTVGSCKKQQEYLVDPEEQLVLDTATFLLSAEYAGHTSTQLNVTLNMVIFEGLEPKNDYSSLSFQEIAQAPYTFDYSNTNSVPQARGGYSSVFLFNKQNKAWINDHRLGFYLRRYLQLVDTDPSRKVAPAAIDPPNWSGDIQWMQDAPDSLFIQSSKTTIQRFFEYMEVGGSEQSGQSNLNIFEGILVDSKEELVNHPNSSGQKSVTIFTDDDLGLANLNDFTQADLAAFQASSVRINVVGNHVPEVLSAIATESGGFVAENDTANVDLTHDPVQDIAVYMMNLDRMVSGNVGQKHICNLTITTTGTFNSGSHYSFAFMYNNKAFKFSVLIP